MAVATPAVRVADPAFNGEQTLALIRRAAERKAALVLFPGTRTLRVHLR